MLTGPITRGQRVFTSGHSFHTWVAEILCDMAASAGIKDHQNLGISFIGGSRVIQHWDLPDDQNTAKKALQGGNVDVLTLSPIWLPDEGIEKFARFGLGHNGKLRITVQEFWLPNDTYEPVYPLQVEKIVDHNAASLAELGKKHELFFHDMEGYVRDVNQRVGKDAVLIVPVAQAVLALRERIVAGQAPGLKEQAELFSDSWGHPTVPTKVLSSYCHFAVIYRHSPTGLPAPGVLAAAKHPGWDERLNRLLQELAWDAVAHHPMSGVRQ